jgi:acyl-coenzyme A synthetase/AMP-(fatty) acid ligase
MKDDPTDSEQATRMLQDHVKRKLLPYRYSRIIEFLRDLPNTGTGKIDPQTLLNGTCGASDEIPLSPTSAGGEP